MSKTISMAPGEYENARYTYQCHARCCDRITRKPTQHVVRMDSLVVAYVRAARAGATEILLPLEQHRSRS